MAGIGTVRRHRCLKAIEAGRAGDWDLAGVWRAKQLAVDSRVLPQLYPLIGRLNAAGYFTFDDTVGATSDEFEDAGFSRREAQLLAAAFGDEDMGYFMANGRYADTQEVTLAASAAHTTDEYSTPIELGDRAILRLTLDVTAIAGTPSLTVTVYTSATSGGTYRSLGAFTEATATGSEAKSFSGCDRFVKVHFDLGSGCTSATCSVSGEAV